MLRRFLSGFAVLATLFFFVLPASAQQRIALVIGNAAYPKGAIATSLADGGLVAEALTSIGFEIVEGADVNQADLRRLIGEFLAKVEAAGPDAIAVVYFSGYGLEFEGDNYLVPVDAGLERDGDIPNEAVPLFDLLRPLAGTKAAAKIVVLDATRPLPFQIPGGKLANGLGAIESAPGMIIGFASAPGTAAPDGPGPYGAYATAIAEMVREPGVGLEALFASIRVRVAEATNGAQVPWNVSQGINPQIMLVPGAPAVAPPGAPQAIVSGVPRRPVRDVGPEQAYADVIESDNLDTYTEYVRAYPNSAYTPRVWAIIRQRREALAWRRALLVNTPEAYWTYMARYPDGMYAFDAERRLRRLSAGPRPPAGFRMMMWDDVPPPLDGEPTRFIDTYPGAPPPMRRLRPPPAFIVGLPPPQRPAGRGVLWRRTNAMPVIIAPRIIPGGPQFRQKGPTPLIVNRPPGFPPKGPQPFMKKGPIGTRTTNPTVTATPPIGKQQFRKGPGTITTNPAVTTNPTNTGNPKPFIKRGGPIGTTTTNPTVTRTNPTTTSTGNPQQFRRGPPTGTTTTNPTITTTTPPRAPVVRAVPPPPPPKLPVVTTPKGPPPSAKKCVVVNGQQVCK